MLVKYEFALVKQFVWVINTQMRNLPLLYPRLNFLFFFYYMGGGACILSGFKIIA